MNILKPHSGSCVAVNEGTDLSDHQKYLYMCFEDEQKSYGFGKTRRRVIKHRTFKSLLS